MPRAILGLAPALLVSCLAAPDPSAPGAPPGDSPPAGAPPGGAPPEGTPAGDPPCPARLARFAEAIEPVLVAECAGCHQAGGLAGASRFVLPAEDDRQARYAAFARAAAIVEYGAPIVLSRPSLAHPEGHPGGLRLPADGPAYASFARFVAELGAPGCAADPGPPAEPPPADPACALAVGPGRLRRLTPAELERSATALLGRPVAVADRFPAEPVVNGYDNDADHRPMTPLFAERLLGVAEELAAEAPLERWMSCPAAAVTEGCRDEFIRRAGAAAFRRPLTSAEVSRYAALAVATGEAPDLALRTVLAAMFQSPSFLYRDETVPAEGVALTARAEALAYAVAGQPPDAALGEAAASAALAEPQRLEAEARRLFRGAAGRAQLVRFVRAWLGVDRLLTVPKDPATYPELDDALRQAMSAELDRFVAGIAERGGTLTDLLTSRETELGGRLAAHYGLADTLAEGSRVDLGPRRAGILTRAAVLTTWAKPAASSPIHRGLLVRERLLCQELAPPPPGVNANPPPVDPNVTGRERYRPHAEVEPCRSCHVKIDPIGFGFERFDGIGRLRELEAGRPVDDHGEIVGVPRGGDVAFADVAELTAWLGGSEDVARCFVGHYLQFTLGTEARDPCLEARVTARFLASRSLEDLVVGAAIESAAPVAPPTAEPEVPPAPTPPPPPPADEGLVVSRRSDSDWGAGYCASVTVENRGPAAMVWAVELEIEGTITQNWNSVASAASGRVRFAGADWNREVAAGGTQGFGFCANR